MDIAFTPVFILGASILWGFLAYRIAMKETKTELGLILQLETWIPIILVASITFATFLMPQPWNLSVSLAIAGLGIAAWNDWKTHYLWDEIVVTTGVLSGVAMLIGGQGNASMQGGTICAAITLFVYFGSKLFGADTGFGDVKHSTAIGFALGPAGGVSAYMAAAVTIVLITLFKVARSRGVYSFRRNEPVPFGPALTFGMVVSAAGLSQINTVLQSITA